jgi:hypothetical protein
MVTLCVIPNFKGSGEDFLWTILITIALDLSYIIPAIYSV